MARGKRSGEPAKRGPINAEAHALKVAVQVARAWHKGSGPDQAHVPLGIVATIAVAGLAKGIDKVAEEVRSASPVEFVHNARRIWAATLARRPDLALSIRPLLGWLFADLSELALQRIKRTADAAVEAGQLDLTATERRFDCDLFGPVLGALRSRNEMKVNAQMYTPGDIARALIAVALGDLKAGQSFCDDTVGTGGILRAAAAVVCNRGFDPAEMLWFGADTDELAVACAAVNGLLWELGPRVVLYVGDVLAHPNWPDEALRRRAKFLERLDSLSPGLRALAFIRRL
ncbi:N-6 DNA methylase [Amycolatopsis sp. SID8362]|uniref:N-6 DNA methylase n=1 Tax=Amycolatopsis sp. SID8362 TaxID=2690346 RepID=UPI00136E2256|nr:N-6 DNA methylase [Amycolatopsis sp. SID8362]NBH06041.1 N-6 DNA methylase [Amycolatopsis sp. SID8362]NED42740.1 SAM-dependent DNA methyltransferase [Amycolatopsis sp. SID8362]